MERTPSGAETTSRGSELRIWCEPKVESEMASGSAEAVEVLHSVNCRTGKRLDRVGPRKLGAAEERQTIEARRASLGNMPVGEPAAVRVSSTPGSFISQESLTFHKEQTKPYPAMRLPTIKCSNHPQQNIGVDRPRERYGSDTVDSSTWSTRYGCRILVAVIYQIAQVTDVC